MTPFPLLQLPLVAMEHVLCMMSPIELIDVSLTSSRAKRCVKSFSKTKKKFSVSFSNYWSSVSFRRDQMIWTYIIHIDQDDANMCANILKDLENSEIIIKVSEEPLKDIMKWYDYAREVLNCKIYCLALELDHPSSENRRIIDWIAAQTKTVEWLDLSSADEESGDDVKYLMERINVSKHFNFCNAQFIDYKQLLRLKSPVIVLRDSILTSQEINRFLRSWMSCETHLDLEALQINILGPNAMNAFYDYHMISQVENEIFTMKRCDGKKQASVTVVQFMYGWCLCLIVH
uniref:F-box domain-containing protein n=1 Tax=Caenorhabditis tropicalis TaxID=1561998 RepID=A0A1I7UU36_9PELO